MIGGADLNQDKSTVLVWQDVSRGEALCLSARGHIYGYSSPGVPDDMRSDGRTSDQCEHRSRAQKVLEYGPRNLAQTENHP